ncbi:hypothetical protein FHR99_001824 [Litorivivens lipolytica]|uniref:Thaumarchaeal output domain-containing protein n=1 Tax=Litorivivens lipolytica TaxID=1524264 RepID=A0A7W4W505_9GAMM|nr:hypothetical protein [Litorivivens lipolytica]MBB3047558.1 hypothetical protein [Litorivivens lipolytica]
MVSVLRNNTTSLAESHTLNYELIELKEFDRVTDEASAVRSIFGAPVLDKAIDRRTLPLVITGYDKHKILQLVRDTRAHPENCLRPIAVIGLADHASDPLLEQLTDGILPPRPDSEQLKEMSLTLSMLYRQLRAVKPAADDRPLTLLQYLYTRGSKLEPLVSPDEHQAYSFPLAEIILGGGAGDVRELMDDMARHTVVSVKHVDRIFTCPDCSSYRVCAKELCPECNSTNLEAQESIHHFRCGYVAPEAEFMVTGRPRCPKCHGDVQHIGVEYNRPGQFVVCGDCNFWATEPVLQAWCAACNTYHSPADLRPVNISSYSLTQNAMTVARTGTWNPQQAALQDSAPAKPKKPRPAGRKRSKAMDAIARVVLKVADDNDNPTTIYSACLSSPGEDADEELQTARMVIQQVASESLLCVERRNDELMIVLHDSPERRTPTCRQLEKAVLREAGIDLSISEVEDNDAPIVADQADRYA